MSKSTLSSVVSDLVRAQMGSSVSSTVTDDDLDRHVAELILKEAKQKAERYGKDGIRAYLARNLDSNAPKTNKRFLSSIIRNTDDHNKTILRAQALAAQEARMEREEQERKERRARAEEAVEAERRRRRKGEDIDDWAHSWGRDRRSDRKRRERSWERDDGGEDRRERRHRHRSHTPEKRNSSRHHRRSHRSPSSSTHALSKREDDEDHDHRRRRRERKRARSPSEDDDQQPRRKKQERSADLSRRRRPLSTSRQSPVQHGRTPAETHARSPSLPPSDKGGSVSGRADRELYTTQDTQDAEGSAETLSREDVLRAQLKRKAKSRAVDSSPSPPDRGRSRSREQTRKSSRHTSTHSPSPEPTCRSSRRKYRSESHSLSPRRSASPARDRNHERSKRKSSRRTHTGPSHPGSSSSRTLHSSRTPSRSRSRSPSIGPAPDNLPSKMDKYFESSYDPRLDVAPLSMPTVPATGLISDAEFAGWDAMLEIIRLRRQDKEDKKALERWGGSKEKEKDRSEKDGEVSALEIKYKKRGSVREWDMGKEGF